jgi:hypothetical protein
VVASKHADDAEMAALNARDGFPDEEAILAVLGRMG